MKKFELGWKVLKELLSYEGVAVAATGSPREILKAAYRFYPCMDENIWLGLYLLSRNLRKASKRNTMVFLRSWCNDNLITI